ncbi:hypothetical protein C798_24050 [Herbaspirillum rubrisubalbicans Os34]|uniref:Type II/III secretion system secretin-like domain-containing protein n=2 Tax=Herbaspirillum rubrisubalbicans TaxID=80842 RepID=A0A6M4A0G4_9BURK|nr:hypothetical protein C798_24050 [Herbaspirillum rubrisubalbicans Os34]
MITALLMVYSTLAVAAPSGPLLPLTPLSMPLPPGAPPQSDSAMEFSRVRVAEAVEAMYTQILKTPYLIQPEVVADERLVSFRFGTGVSARSEVSRFMGLLGLSVRTVNGVDIVGIVREVEPDKEPFVYPGNGSAPVQSVEYRSSGVIFDLKPIVRESVVDLTVGQQLSNFIVTQTGVNNSPTLTKREVSTSLSVADGDVVIIGGLAENRESLGRIGFSFLPDWMRSNTGQNSKTEILLVLQVSRL